jgi:hypothetical protein
MARVLIRVRKSIPTRALSTKLQLRTNESLDCAVQNCRAATPTLGHFQTSTWFRWRRILLRRLLAQISDIPCRQLRSFRAEPRGDVVRHRRGLVVGIDVAERRHRQRAFGRMPFGLTSQVALSPLTRFTSPNGRGKKEPNYSLYAVRNPPQCLPCARTGTSISRIITSLPLPMSRA